MFFLQVSDLGLQGLDVHVVFFLGNLENVVKKEDGRNIGKMMGWASYYYYYLPEFPFSP